MEQLVVNIWTDGACSGNPGAGGWAAILQFGTLDKEISGYKTGTTNNEMELYALMYALAALSVSKRHYTYVVHTDSMYVINIFTTWILNWLPDGNGKANWDVIKAIYDVISLLDVRFEWVRGHSGDPMNERVDKLAVEKRNIAKEIVKQSRKNA